MSPAQANEQIDARIVYDERGLAPCVVQDWNTGEVLTLAYMNAQALARTRETGELHLYSRSREQLWHKGETSGNVQSVKALRLDCDGDALLPLNPSIPESLIPRTIPANLRPTPTISRRWPARPASRAILPLEVQTQMPNLLAEFPAFPAPAAVFRTARRLRIVGSWRPWHSWRLGGCIARRLPSGTGYVVFVPWGRHSVILGRCRSARRC